MVREFDDDEVRSAGPSVVWQGPGEAPAVLVLDPAGEAKHNELPATWRDLAEHLRVGWCRLPAEVGDEPSVEDILGGLRQRAHLVASGTAAELALRLALEHSDVVRSVIAVDPSPSGPSAPRVNDFSSSAVWWDDTTAARRKKLLSRGIRVECFVHRDSDPAVRVEPPVPLGHPDVVGRVVQTLLSFQGDRADPEPVEPERREIAEAWRAVRERFGPPLERARRSGGGSA
ncbi:hypothetical protein B0I33_101108 [Prauserella shujinwangii]|uniref:Alpha/beta hydrolase family protein n=1 Tax=Prauserella shujinwangii TaxID=1453103 RepID=A0A2T0M2K7_9PSEU|nr:hypothetical protein [Prauserella shujinwangii]PRX50956.1 hypothetical protein B0I33_101108 [Prauserella shujinwangii]